MLQNRKTHIFLQKSVPLQPKTNNILPKFCQKIRLLVAGGATFFERRAHHYRTEVAESGRREGRAELLAKRSCYLKEGVHLGECSVRRNWYRSLSTSLVPPEGFGKLRNVAAFWKNPEKKWSKFSKILTKFVSYKKNQQFFSNV